jgi:hypothetical protein
MGFHNVCTDWMYQYCVLYLEWWWLNEPKHVAESLILITNICCVYWLSKLLYYCKTQRDGSYRRIEVTKRGGRKRKQLLDELKEQRGCWRLREKAPYRTLSRSHFSTGDGPVVRETAGWNESPSFHKHCVLPFAFAFRLCNNAIRWFPWRFGIGKLLLRD